MFPAPREVDRELYYTFFVCGISDWEVSPAPLEVVGIYTSITGNYDIYDILGFPAPLEADR